MIEIDSFFEDRPEYEDRDLEKSIAVVFWTISNLLWVCTVNIIINNMIIDRITISRKTRRVQHDWKFSMLNVTLSSHGRIDQETVSRRKRAPVRGVGCGPCVPD